MMIKLYIFPILGLISPCTVNADVDKSEFNDLNLYYSFKTCDGSKKCKILSPLIKSGKYIFKNFEPVHDEFYIKDNNGYFYLYYKNVYSEDVQIGWAKAKVDKINNSELNLNIDKINLALGGVDFIKSGYSSKHAESKNYKLGMYYLDDNYEEAPYYQKQNITFKRINDTLLLDCKSYMNNPSVKDSFTGIFYRVCSDNKKVYFKLLK